MVKFELDFYRKYNKNNFLIPTAEKDYWVTKEDGFYVIRELDPLFWDSDLSDIKPFISKEVHREAIW